MCSIRKRRISDGSDEEPAPKVNDKAASNCNRSAIEPAGSDEDWDAADADSDQNGEQQKSPKRVLSDLDDDDYELIEENTGKKIKRPNKFKRIRQIDGSDSEDNWKNEDSDVDSIDYDDDDDFIDDDLNGDSKRKAKKQKKQKKAQQTNDHNQAGNEHNISIRTGNYYKPIENDGDDWDADDDDDNDNDNDNDEGCKSKPPTSRSAKPQRCSSNVDDEDWDDCVDDSTSRSEFSGKKRNVRRRPPFIEIPQEVVRRTAAPKDEIQIETEAHWIYNRIFGNRLLLCLCKICREEYEPFEAISGIQDCLNALVAGHEEVDGESIDDICFRRMEDLDKRWSELNKRKVHLVEQLQNMQTYLQDKNFEREITELDLDTAREVQCIEEWKDAHDQFMFYYATELAQMRKQLQLEDQETPEKKTAAQRKQPLKFGPYRIYIRKGIGNFTKLFGLTPAQFAENVYIKEQVYEVKDSALSPVQVAAQFVPQHFATTEEAIKAAQFVVAKQLACEPKLRKAVREMIYKHSTVSVQPTKRGRSKLDTSHPLYSLMYVNKKPLRSFAVAEWLNIMEGVEHNFFEIAISEQFDYVERTKRLYKSAGNTAGSTHGRTWDGLRAECVESAIKSMIIPDIIKELRAALQQEANECARGLNCKCKKFVYSFGKNPFQE